MMAIRNTQIGALSGDDGVDLEQEPMTFPDWNDTFDAFYNRGRYDP